MEVFQRSFGEINISKQKGHYLFINILEQTKIKKLLGYRDKLKNEDFSKFENLLGNVKIRPFPFHI